MSAPTDSRHLDFEVDVAIVGHGPVGQVLAGLLGRAGHQVAVFERHQEIYRLPRAVHIDHEIMRVLQTLGAAEALAPSMLPVHDYQWFGADGELLLRFDMPSPAGSGWDSDYMFFQPELEAELDRRACSHDGVTLYRGWSAEALVDSEAGAELTLRRVVEDDSGRLVETDERRTVRARWVLGADGANSFVREASGISRRDLGFQERWLVVDAKPHDMGALARLPIACQWCDPVRPTTHVQSGPRHRRWEFMLLPGELASDFDDPERVWSLLAPWYTPADGPLTRSTVYEFRSMVADEMRRGHALLVGDAAHLTPPFLGQGLCSGVRDALNVAWKLDLVLRGLASERLLDTIDPERQPQNEAIIRLAVELGKVLCQLDPAAAAERDAAIRSAPAFPPPGLAPLTGGALHHVTEPGSDSLAGTLSVQGTVERDGTSGRFDDVVGGGFQLIVAGGDPLASLGEEHRTLLDALDVKVASLDADQPNGIRDLDGRLSAWLGEHGVHAVLVRPDFYAFGSATSEQDLPGLLDDLQTQLQINPPVQATAGEIR